MIDDQAEISGAVFDAIEAALPDGAPRIHFEYMPADKAMLPAASMQTLAGDPYVRRYVDGSYIGRYRFAIYLRQASDDDGSRLDAMATLGQIATAVNAAAFTLPDGYDFHRCIQDTLPHRIAADDAFDDWQVTFTVQYGKQKGQLP